MNWKEHPYLFANEKFKVSVDDEIGHIDGILNSGVHDTGEMQLKLVGFSYFPQVNRCTLIARPIEDMTDEEYEGLTFVNTCKERRFFINLLGERCKNDHLRFDDARHLLSIGVYPFDQSHFDDGIVIDSTTLHEQTPE